jgi:serine phosphatase RsbU (regulator of sigma subunit)
VDSVHRIKAKNGPDLVLPGSLTLTSVLLEHGLADEVVLLVNPVVLGKGKRFFADGTLPRTFALGGTKALSSGILVNVYKLIPTLAEEAVSRARLEREIEIAREVQERLFPQTFPNVTGVEMAAHCRPAQAVGGDYYDLISIRDGSLAEAGHASGESISSTSGITARDCDRLGIAIGDISGKGVSAALLMASLHASLRSQTLSGAGDLGTKMANVNRLLYDASDSNRYATFFYAELDCGSRTLHYVNGGHNPPAVLRKKEDGAWQVLRLGEGGPVVGLLAGAAYKQQILHLLPGDILLAFTDGISEAMNAAEDEWGEDRMIAEAQTHADLSAAELMQHLFRAADAFAAGAAQHDDMTLVVLRISV